VSLTLSIFNCVAYAGDWRCRWAVVAARAPHALHISLGLDLRNMTLTGMKKHVGILEQAGLVATEKVRRVRTCKLGLRGLATEAAWIERQGRFWAARFNELDKLSSN
jgi:hypothetical protein